MARKTLRHPDIEPTHPGEILREDVLPSLGITVLAAAEALMVSRQTLHRVLAGTVSITPEMALRLGKFCGNDPAFWLRMQETYNLWHAKRQIADELAKIKPAKAA